MVEIHLIEYRTTLALLRHHQADLFGPPQGILHYLNLQRGLRYQLIGHLDLLLILRANFLKQPPI